MTTRGRRSVGSLAVGMALISLLSSQEPASAAKRPLSTADDPYLEQQWGLSRIEATKAWDIADGAGAVIAIVDTGVDLEHPDLKRKLIVRKGADFVDPDGSNGPQDEHFHGTHVAGIAAAGTYNGIGGAGVAPRAEIMPVRVLNQQGSGSTDQIAAGIRFAAAKDADVINLSLGVPSPFGEVLGLTGSLKPIYDAIGQAWTQGAVVIVAAGNSAFPLCAEPAAAPRALCVGSTNFRDGLSSFSNFDSTITKTYLTAPGGSNDGSCEHDILSTWLRKTQFQKCGPEEGYGTVFGTSMAAPFVSGVAALLVGQGLENDEIVQRLISTTDDLGAPGRDPLFGYGRLNALKAVKG